MRILISCLLCVVLAATAAAQDRTVVVQPVEGPPLEAGVPGWGGVCVYGNQNPAAFAITDWIYGDESYATMFLAERPPCGCADGFFITTVHMLMNFGPEDVPVSFDAYATFRENSLDEATAGCNVPGAFLCSSPVWQSPVSTVNITSAGLYDIALDMGMAECPCARFGYTYAVTMDILTPFTSYPDAVTDDASVGCTSYNDYGQGWLDQQSFGFPGENIVFADVWCCADAVPEEPTAWGALKSLYR